MCFVISYISHVFISISFPFCGKEIEIEILYRVYTVEFYQIAMGPVVLMGGPNAVR